MITFNLDIDIESWDLLHKWFRITLLIPAVFKSVTSFRPPTIGESDNVALTELAAGRITRWEFWALILWVYDIGVVTLLRLSLLSLLSLSGKTLGIGNAQDSEETKQAEKDSGGLHCVIIMIIILTWSGLDL